MDALRAYGPPPPEAVYTDINTTITTIQGYAKRNSYALSKRDSTLRRIVYVYDRFSNPRVNKNIPIVHESKKRSGSTSKKYGCTMKLVLKQELERLWLSTGSDSLCDSSIVPKYNSSTKRRLEYYSKSTP